MAFNPREKRLVVRNKEGNYKPCVMCGKTYPLPDAVHIIDEKEYEYYLSQLFSKSKKFVLIFSSNCSKNLLMSFSSFKVGTTTLIFTSPIYKVL